MQTVLIADDWPLLRARLDEALREKGYFTVAVDTAQEAVGLLRWMRVDLLLARERLADLDGPTLAGLLRRRGHEELVIVLLAEGASATPGAGVDAATPRGLDAEPVVKLVRHLLRPVTCQFPPSAESGHPCATSVA